MFNILLREFISNSALLFGVRCLVVRWRNETSVRIWADARGLLQSCAVEIALFSWRSKATIAVVVCRRPSRIPCVVRIELYIYTVQCGLTVRQSGRAAGYYADRWHATAANWQEYTSARLRMIKVTYTVCDQTRAQCVVLKGNAKHVCYRCSDCFCVCSTDGAACRNSSSYTEASLIKT